MPHNKVKLEFSLGGTHKFDSISSDGLTLTIHERQMPDCITVNYKHLLAEKFQGEWFRNEKIYFIPCLHVVDYLFTVCEDTDFKKQNYFCTKNIKSLFEKLRLRSYLSTEQEKTLLEKLPHYLDNKELDSDAKTIEEIVERVKCYFIKHSEEKKREKPRFLQCSHHIIRNAEMISKLQYRFPNANLLELAKDYDLLGEITSLCNFTMPVRIIFASDILIDYVASVDKIRTIDLNSPGLYIRGLVKILPKLTQVESLRIYDSLYNREKEDEINDTALLKYMQMYANAYICIYFNEAFQFEKIENYFPHSGK